MGFRATGVDGAEPVFQVGGGGGCGPKQSSMQKYFSDVFAVIEASPDHELIY